MTSENLSYPQALQELLDGATYIAREGQQADEDCIMMNEFQELIIDGSYSETDYSATDWFMG